MSAVDIFTYILILPKSRVFLAAVFWMWVHCDSLKATKCQSYNGDAFDKWCIFYWRNQHAREVLMQRTLRKLIKVHLTQKYFLLQ